MRGPTAPTLSLPAAALCGWAGLFVHNREELPEVTILSPESLWPLLLNLALTVWWFTSGRSAPTIALLMVGLLHAAGSIVTVLPLPILPFSPEQSLPHYIAHALYFMAQVPLILVTATQLRFDSRRRESSLTRQ
jgi:hypothetical protein